MALSINHTTDSGINIPSAYLRIDEIHLIKKDKLFFHVSFYANKNEQIPFYKEMFKTSYDLSQSNPIAQAYDFLKTKSEFGQAVDC
jgi:hypothetical protein